MRPDIANDKLRRRELLKGAAAGTTALSLGLAGCTGNGDGGGGTSSGDGGGGTSSGDGGGGTSSGDGGGGTSSGDGQESVDQWFVSGNDGINTTQVQWNIYNPQNLNTIYSRYLFDSLGMYDPVNDAFSGLLADDWGVEDGTFVVDLRDQTWSNGNEVTAGDVVTKMKLDKAIGNPIWGFLDNVEAPGEKTVHFNLSQNGNVNTNWLTYILMTGGMQINTPESVYGKYVDRLEDTETDTQVDEVLSDLTTWRWEDPISSGVFEIGERNSNLIRFPTREDGHPIAEQLNFSGYEFRVTSPEEVIPALENGNIVSGDVIADEEQVNNMSEKIRHVRFPWFNGIGIYFNFQRDIFHYSGLRKAFAYLLNRQIAVRNVSPVVNEEMQFPHGLTGGGTNVPKNWLGDTYNGFEGYGPNESKVSKAQAAMEADGFTKEGDTWYRPDGDPIDTIQITGPANWSWIRMLNTGGPAWRDFGLPVEINGVEATSMFNQASQGNFDMITDGLDSRSPHPGDMMKLNYATLVGSVASSSPNASIPAEFEVPMPVGDPNGANGTEVINIVDELDELAVVSSDQETETVRRLAWVTNQALPFFPVYEKIGFKGINSTGWNMPPEDDPIMKMNQPDHGMLLHGEIEANPE